MSIAPVQVNVYDRLDKLKACISSLLANELSRDTVIYISSDNYSKEEDKVKIRAVRDYINKIIGFKKVVKIFHKTNLGSPGASLAARKIVLENHDRFILLEDDVIVSPLFLEYINKGLEFYKNDQNVFSICGFSPYTLDNKYFERKNYLFKSSRWNPWGYGMWKNKYLNFLEFRNELNGIRNLNDFLSHNFCTRVKEVSHEYYIQSLVSKKYNVIPEFDISVGLYCIKNNFSNIYSTKTFTLNNGADGSGLRALKEDTIALIDKSFFSEKLVEFETLKFIELDDSAPTLSRSIITNKIKVLLIKLKLFYLIKKLHRFLISKIEK